MPRVSVILTAYNRPKMLKKAIDSVLSQDFKDFELIILDDNSNDKEHINVLSSYWGDDRVVIYKSNIKDLDRGEVVRYAALINIGLELANGDLITYLCDDDFYAPNRLSRMVAWFDQNPDKHFLGGDQALFTEKDGQYIDFPTKVRRQTRILTNPKCSVDHSSVMHRMSCVDEVGNWDDSIDLWGTADGEFFNKLAKNGFPMYPLGGDPTDTHIYHDGSWTKDGNWEKLGKQD